MKALVTGSTGFIGAHLCRALLERGYDVRAFHRAGSPLELIRELPVEHAVGDLRDAESLQHAMQGIRVVFHCAAQLGRRPGTPETMKAITVQGTKAVLEAAMATGVDRFIHTSSVAALGVPRVKGVRVSSTGAAQLIDERHAYNLPPGSWPYGYTKHLAELEVGKAVAQGLAAVIVNPAVVLGPGDLNRISGNIVVQVAKRRLPIAAAGGLNVIHIADVVQGHLAALERGCTGERYILGGENLTHRRFLALIADVCGVPAPRLVIPTWIFHSLATPVTLVGRWLRLPIHGQALRRLGIYFYYDTSKARRELGVEAPRTTRQAIEETYAWYMEEKAI
jgi:dihydroflavonol-4-reductase